MIEEVELLRHPAIKSPVGGLSGSSTRVAHGPISLSNGQPLGPIARHDHQPHRPRRPGLVPAEYASDLTPPVTFYVYRDGVLLATTTLASYDVTIVAGDSPVFDVFDRSDRRPDRRVPELRAARLVRSDGGGRWGRRVARRAVRRRELGPQGGGKSQLHRLLRMAEQSAGRRDRYQFRVVPVGTNGNDGTIKTFALLIVRRPDPPDVTYAYNGSARRPSRSLPINRDLIPGEISMPSAFTRADSLRTYGTGAAPTAARRPAPTLSLGNYRADAR
jgi:hypothetical protein